MNIDLYLFPFLKSFAVAIILLALFVALTKKKNLTERNSERHIHQKGVSRLGGVAIILAFLWAIFSDNHLVITTQLKGVVAGIILILVFGLWDDFWELDWRSQLFFQIAAAILVFITGTTVEYITNPLGGYLFLNSEMDFFPSLIFVIVWTVIIMNSMNWLDGADGLSGGIGLIGAVTIFFLSLKPEVNQPPVAIIAAALAGALAGFLIFNFHPARILAGTVGSIFIGFILAVLAIFAGAKIATALLVLSIPLVDTLWVIIERWSAGEKITFPDQRHLHYKLLQLGWSPKKVATFYYGVSIIIALVALNTRAIGKAFAIVAVIIVMLAILWLVRRKTIELKKI